ncbi:hypothetical protein RZN05_13940 [Sphingomonas sp. HF-S4]|uniref:Protein TonB n=1 Tax=Sphingomonas agrestis TaxID=3080540 RepID=A0ABU3YAB2_9SPHN|nr:hypothetical protein [Sphingomonas sp. HF-S4]MDV3458093.1 hypothetical protein [Sphingomonas sp. HF-S4]
MRPSASERLRASLGQRGVAFVLALVVELGLALLLWFMAPPLFEKKPPPTTTVFGIDTAPGDTEQPQRTEQKKADSKSQTRERVREVQPRPVEPPPEPEPPAEPVPETFIRMTRRDYAAADIKGMKSGAPSAPADVGEASGGGSRPGDTAIVGKAPNGEPLYAAAWYRRPTHAELAPYQSRRALGPGWGLIACRTVANHRVEDCQEVAEGPRGSGYAGSVRQAAWQFRVRAPRVGGKELTGTWVSIRITYGQVDSDPD